MPISPIVAQDLVQRQTVKLRFLFVGGWNTIFGYASSIFLYSALESHLHITVIAAIANVLNITCAFILHKLFVFRTKGAWLQEYLRAYMSYGLTALFGILLVWVFVDFFGMRFWLAQGIAIIASVPASFVLQKRFTFKS